MVLQAQLRKQGKDFVAIVPGREVIKLGQDFEAASVAFDKVQADLIAESTRSAGVTSAPRFKVNYRGEFQVIPSGQSMQQITATADTMEALIKDWPVVVATFNAVKGQTLQHPQYGPMTIAATYKDRRKASGNGKDEAKIDIPAVQPTPEVVKA